MAICLSHGGTTIYSSDSPSNELLAATVDGVVFLKRDGEKSPWQVSRKGLEGHHIIALLIEPTTDTIFATMHDGGVAASEDFGRTWEFRNEGLASENVYCIARAQAGDKVRLYVGTEPAHLYVSEDMGRHWNELPALRNVPSVSKWTFPAPPHNAHVKNIAIDPKNPDTIYACVEQGGLFKSVDGGASWKELQGFNDDCHRLLILSSDPQKLYLPTGYGFYRSNDGGESWET
ncbi:MAG TPA: glycosyl hydrolase, partial [Blastocatellia bacterium]|nr:glycosyl hydrolase [Blastocatellia bacterium]